MTGMTVTGRLELAALDATDIVGLASFYAELTGWQAARNVDGCITLRAGDGQEIAFQQVAEHMDATK
jgi:catechol-2,3-dioxygenase